MASRGVNKVIIIGNCGTDPEVFVTKNGDKIVSLSIATSESWKAKDGSNEQRTEWHKVKFFKKLAEIVEQYVAKGSKLYIEGSLRTNKWQDKGGVDHYTTEIIANTMQLLDSKPSSENKTSAQKYAAAQGKSCLEPSDFDDDIPF